MTKRRMGLVFRTIEIGSNELHGGDFVLLGKGAAIMVELSPFLIELHQKLTTKTRGLL
jgi:hypothetical protein